MKNPKDVLNMCVNALQKARSISEENGIREIDELLISLGMEEEGLFEPSTEKLMWTWTNNPKPSNLDASNAVQWLQMKFPSAALVLSMRMSEEGCGDWYDSPFSIVKECKY